MDTRTAHKAVKTALLAAGEERLGNEEAAGSIGYTAGELAAKAGMTLAEFDAECKLSESHTAWGRCVDGWYDQQPKDVSVSEMQTVLNALADRPNHADVVSRMMAELLRRRG
jgi:hypothetical protein